MHVSWSPTALCTIAAATAESTPPDSPQITRAEPTWARMRSTCSAMTLPLFQSAAMPAPTCRKFSITRCPNSECLTSGCHCSPNILRSLFSNAATGVEALLASTSKPSGAFDTESPWLIHAVWSSGWPARSVPPLSPTRTAVDPYSRSPVFATSPPSCCAITWKP
jgi:hypothetical protein